MINNIITISFKKYKQKKVFNSSLYIPIPKNHHRKLEKQININQKAKNKIYKSREKRRS